MLNRSLSSGSRLARFDVASFSRHLATKKFGRPLDIYGCVESTQQVLFQGDPKSEEGLACVADEQTDGRGRGGTVWESPRGCLTFSFQCKIAQAARLPTLQHLVSLAVVRTGNRSASLRIKWPNDIYSDAKYDESRRLKKIGGILLQSRSLSDNSGFSVTVGVGINVLNNLPTTSLREISSSTSRSEITREVVLARFFNTFEPMYNEYLQFGFEPFLREYRELWLHTNQRLQLNDQEHTEVTVFDLSPSTGHLLNVYNPRRNFPVWKGEFSGLVFFGHSQYCHVNVTAMVLLLFWLQNKARDNAGETYELQPDGHSFDLLTGLVRAK